MAENEFRVNNPQGMWLRTEPVVSDVTRKSLLPNGQIVTKLGDADKLDWWHIRTTFGGTSLEGFSKRALMVANAAAAPPAQSGSIWLLIARVGAAIAQLAPHARENYLEAIREGEPLFEAHAIDSPRRMAHFLAQALHETGRFTVLRESMRYAAPRSLEIFGEGEHSAKVTPAEAVALDGREEALAERVYGLGNPKKAMELGNTQPGDGFRYRGNGVLQTTGRDAHRRMGLACKLDFEEDPELVTAAQRALKPALQEWSDGQLNGLADANDIDRTTRRINGGTIGLDKRKAMFAALLPKLTRHLRARTLTWLWLRRGVASIGVYGLLASSGCTSVQWLDAQGVPQSIGLALVAHGEVPGVTRIVAPAASMRLIPGLVGYSLGVRETVLYQSEGRGQPGEVVAFADRVFGVALDLTQLVIGASHEFGIVHRADAPDVIQVIHYSESDPRRNSFFTKEAK